MVALRGSQNIKNSAYISLYYLFYIIYINYNYKLLAGVRKPEIFLDKFKKLALKKDPKVVQGKKKRENEMLI